MRCKHAGVQHDHNCTWKQDYHGEGQTHGWLLLQLSPQLFQHFQCVFFFSPEWSWWPFCGSRRGAHSFSEASRSGDTSARRAKTAVDICGGVATHAMQENQCQTSVGYKTPAYASSCIATQHSRPICRATADVTETPPHHVKTNTGMPNSMSVDSAAPVAVNTQA